MTVTQYPNGQQLISSAMAQTDMNKAIQLWTCAALGINPPNYSLVRVDWQPEGQPFEDRDQDVCYLACTLQDNPYTLVRDRSYDASSVSGKVAETWTYTRCWKVAWVLYGPNSFDRGRMLHSGLFMDYLTDLLAASQLFALTDPPEPGRAPEKINAQWFDRTDFHLLLYENVTETIQDNVVTSVEILVNDNAGLQADITVTKP
jgi:hypothetical protein